MSRVTRSSVKPSDSSRVMSNPEDIQSLLAMMAKTLEAVTKNTKSSSSAEQQATQNVKLENCPVKRASSSLDAWINEVTLWNESNIADDETLRAKKYLRFIDSVRKSEGCTDIKISLKWNLLKTKTLTEKLKTVLQINFQKFERCKVKVILPSCSRAEPSSATNW